MKKFYRKNTVHPTSDHLSFLPAAIFTLTVALSQEDKEVLAYLISCSSGSGNFSGDFSGNNRRTTHKSTAPNSATATSGGTKGGTGGVGGGGGGGGGGADQVLSGNFSGNRRTTQKSSTPNSASDVSTGGSKSVAAVSGGATGGADHVPSFNCYCFSCYMNYWVKWDSSPNRQLIHEILDAYEDGLQSKKEKSKKERRNKNKIPTTTSTSSSSELKTSPSASNLTQNGSGKPDPVEELSGSLHGGGDGGDEEEIGGGDGAAEKGSVRKFVTFLGEKIWNVWN